MISSSCCYSIGPADSDWKLVASSVGSDIVLVDVRSPYTNKWVTVKTMEVFIRGGIVKLVSPWGEFLIIQKNVSIKSITIKKDN
jgi:hypothetical protein